VHVGVLGVSAVKILFFVFGMRLLASSISPVGGFLVREIYRVTIHGRTLESADVRKLLARAVAEKRNMDRILRAQLRSPSVPDTDRALAARCGSVSLSAQQHDA
jgi:hypothetical protein